MKVANTLMVIIVTLVVAVPAVSQDYIEQEYFKDARAKNAAIAAARYAEEGYYYTRFCTYTSAVDSSRVFADTALFFVGRSLMLADTSNHYAHDTEDQALDYLANGIDNTQNGDKLIRTFYPMKDIRAHHSYGINASLYLSNAVMNYFNASMLLSANDGESGGNPYKPLPYQDEVNRLEADEATFVELNATMQSKLASTDKTLKSLRKRLAATIDARERKHLREWIDRTVAEQQYAKTRLKDSAGRLEDIRELLDKKYVDEMASVHGSTDKSQFKTNKRQYYQSNKINFDPELPDGLIYKIQLGFYPRQSDKTDFYGLYPITGETVGSDYVLYYAGKFDHYRQASKGKEYVRNKAVNDAFIVPFLHGEKVNVKKALEVEKRAHTK